MPAGRLSGAGAFRESSWPARPRLAAVSDTGITEHDVQLPPDRYLPKLCILNRDLAVGFAGSSELATRYLMTFVAPSKDIFRSTVDYFRRCHLDSQESVDFIVMLNNIDEFMQLIQAELGIAEWWGTLVSRTPPPTSYGIAPSRWRASGRGSTIAQGRAGSINWLACRRAFGEITGVRKAVWRARRRRALEAPPGPRRCRPSGCRRRSRRSRFRRRFGGTERRY
jgi:hypothetical protein